MVRITDRRYMTEILSLFRKTPTQTKINADILSKGFQKCSLSGIFCQNPSISLVVMTTKRLNLRKILNNINSSEALRAIKLKLCKYVHSISLFKSIILLSLLMHFGSYGNLCFHRLIVGKIKTGFIAVSLQIV